MCSKLLTMADHKNNKNDNNSLSSRKEGEAEDITEKSAIDTTGVSKNVGQLSRAYKRNLIFW